MKKLFNALTIASVLLTGSMVANAATPYRLSVEVRSGSYNSWNEVTIVSTTDNLVIQKVTMNRDHCRVGVHPITGKRPFPITLKYGESVTVDFFNCPNMLDAQVYTNQGNSEWSIGNKG